MLRELLEIDDDGQRNRLNTIAAWITIATPVVAVVAGAIAYLMKKGEMTVVAGAFGLGFALAVCMFALKIFVPVRPKPRPPRVYAIRKESMAYAFDDADPTQQSHAATFSITALEPGVETFERRMKWSGKGTEHPPTATNNNGGSTTSSVAANTCTLLGPVPKEHYNCYYVHFGRALAVNEPRNVTIRQDFEDPQYTMETYLQKRVREEMDELHLEVRFSRNKMPATESVFLIETLADYPYTTISCNRGAFEADGKTVRFHPAKPEVGHLYSIAWSW